MKKLISIALVLGAMILGSVVASGQTVTKSNEFSGFTGLEASNDFEITLRSGAENKVEWVVDKVIENLVQIYQKGNILYLAFDKKAMTKEQKNYFKGKNAPKKVLRATVYSQNLSSVKLLDNVKFDASGITLDSESFYVYAEDETIINNLIINGKDLSVETTGKAVANIQATVTSATVKGSSKSVINLNLTGCENVAVKSDNSCVINYYGNSSTMDVESSGSSKILVANGAGEKLIFTCKNSAEIDATGYEFKKAVIAMAGGKAYVNVADVMKLDLKRGSLVSFLNDPVIDIVKVEKSSIIHYDGKK